MIHRLKNLYKFLLHQDKSLYRAFASITSLRVVEKLSGLAISVMLFRYMTKEDVATYGFIQTIVAMCAIFGLQELQNTISQSVSRGQNAQVTSTAAPRVMAPSTQGLPNHTMTGARRGTDPRTTRPRSIA